MAPGYIRFCENLFCYYQRIFYPQCNIVYSVAIPVTAVVANRIIHSCTDIPYSLNKIRKGCVRIYNNFLFNFLLLPKMLSNLIISKIPSKV